MRRGFREILHLARCLILTRVFYRNSRLIRFPIDVRGKTGIDFGRNLTTGHYCRLESFSTNGEKSLKFGNDVQINDFVHISAKKSVEIGNNVLIASKVFITDLEHGSYHGDNYDSSPDSIVVNRNLSSAPVVIEDNVWIGESVSVLPGVKIGKNSIIGANGVVTKSIPPNSIAVGNPARVVKRFNYITMKWEKIG